MPKDQEGNNGPKWSDSPTQVTDFEHMPGDSEPPTLIAEHPGGVNMKVPPPAPPPAGMGVPNSLPPKGTPHAAAAAPPPGVVGGDAPPGVVEYDTDPPTLLTSKEKAQAVEEIPLMDGDILVEDEESIATIDVPVDLESPISEPPAFNPEPIGKFGRYELLGRLAIGGMAEIYLAREQADHSASRYVVIKRIRSNVADDDEFVSMFKNEARLAVHLRHPNICHLYEFGFQGGHHFLAMEFIDGATLHKIARKAAKQGGIPVPYAVKVISTVAGALAYAHSAKDQHRKPLNIVHRDVSPHNIMLGYDGVVKLLDFGVAKATTQDVLTMAGVVRGKFAYMSPQQCVGEKLDGRSDVFSLGTVLYEMLTGKRLYRRENQFDTMRAVVDDPVPSIRAIKPDLPEELDRIVQKALQKDPNLRYATADLMQEDLDHFLAARREVVSTARMAAYMEDLFREEIGRGPQLDQDVDLSGDEADDNAQLAPAQEASGSNTSKQISATTHKLTQGQLPHVQQAPNNDKLWLGIAVAAIAIALGLIAWKVISTDDPGSVDGGSPGPGTGPPTTAPAGLGTVIINGAQAGDVITADGMPVANTAGLFQAKVKAGEVVVKVQRAGHDCPDQTVRVSKDQVLGVQIKCIAAKDKPASLSITGTEGAVVFANRKQVGTLPLSLDSLPPGKYRIEVRKPGFRAQSESITLEPGTKTEFTFNLDKAVVVPKCSVTIANTIPWSNVYAGSRKLGTTPGAKGRVPIRGGKVTLKFKHPGMPTVTRSFPCSPNGSITKVVKLK